MVFNDWEGTMVFLARACVLASVFVALAVGAAKADDGADFYKGRQVRVLIGFGPGGGYDLFTRIIAKYMGPHFPGGTAQVIPQNMPGAGSLTAANNIANVAPHDGTVFASVASGMPSSPLINPEQAKFDSRKLSWIGSASSEIYIDIVWHTSPVQTVDQLMKQQLIIGGTGVGTATDDFPAIDREVLGFKFKLIPGYNTTKEIEVAMERGELQALSGTTWNSTKARDPEWLASNKISVLAQYGRKKHPDLPDVPLVTDYAKTEADRQALNLVFSRQDMGRPYVAPPELITGRLKIMRDAFDATMKDPAFVADAKKADLDISPINGDAVTALVEELYRSPPEVVERVRKALSAETRVLE
jgi:tripartite-type tricarboxylate transporter receptor subunit TctC